MRFFYGIFRIVDQEVFTRSVVNASEIGEISRRVVFGAVLMAALWQHKRSVRGHRQFVNRLAKEIDILVPLMMYLH
jgi:hypothetical protein